MQTAGSLSVEVHLEFQGAAVGFAIQIGPDREAEGIPMHIRPRALIEGKIAHFTPQSSYPLADFVGGFCRWLGTKRITASHTADEITAHFHPQYTVLQILAVLQELCQMFEDKFAAYPHPILL